MKTQIFKLVTLIILPLTYSCVKDYETTTIFNVKNVSTHKVTLTVYNAEIQSLGVNKDTSFNLEINKSMSSDFVLKGKDNPSNYPFGILADSAFLLFDNNLKIIYRKTQFHIRNILEKESFTLQSYSNNIYIYIYEITEDDFETAD